MDKIAFPEFIPVTLSGPQGESRDVSVPLHAPDPPAKPYRGVAALLGGAGLSWPSYVRVAELTMDRGYQVVFPGVDAPEVLHPDWPVEQQLDRVHATLADMITARIKVALGNEQLARHERPVWITHSFAGRIGARLAALIDPPIRAHIALMPAWTVDTRTELSGAFFRRQLAEAAPMDVPAPAPGVTASRIIAQDAPVAVPVDTHGYERTVIVGGGHLAWLTYPNQFAEAFLRLLEAVPWREPAAEPGPDAVNPRRWPPQIDDGFSDRYGRPPTF